MFLFVLGPFFAHVWSWPNVTFQSWYNMFRGMSKECHLVGTSLSCEHKFFHWNWHNCVHRTQLVSCFFSSLHMDITFSRNTFDAFTTIKAQPCSCLKSQVYAAATHVDRGAAAVRQSETGSDRTRQYEVWCVYLLVRLPSLHTYFLHYR